MKYFRYPAIGCAICGKTNTTLRKIHKKKNVRICLKCAKNVQECSAFFNLLISMKEAGIEYDFNSVANGFQMRYPKGADNPYISVIQLPNMPLDASFNDGAIEYGISPDDVMKAIQQHETEKIDRDHV